MRRRLGTILMVAGSAALVWCASVWASATLFEKYEGWRWNAQRPASTSGAASIELPAPATLPPPKLHDVIAWIDVPRLRISTAVLEGDDDVALRLGAGHIPGTPLPGSSGNVGIAAHRDSFFRALESTHIVRPSDVGVLANSSRSELTLVTCYPFRYVGSAPLRFIVRARRTG